MTRFQLLTFAFSPLSSTFELWVGSIARLSAVSLGRVRRFRRLSNRVIELSDVRASVVVWILRCHGMRGSFFISLTYLSSSTFVINKWTLSLKQPSMRERFGDHYLSKWHVYKNKVLFSRNDNTWFIVNHPSYTALRLRKTYSSFPLYNLLTLWHTRQSGQSV